MNFNLGSLGWLRGRAGRGSGDATLRDAVICYAVPCHATACVVSLRHDE